MNSRLFIRSPHRRASSVGGTSRPSIPAATLGIAGAPSRRRALPDRDYSSPTETWLTIADALDLIMQRSNVGPDAARTILTDACASGKVRSRYIVAHQGKILLGQINPGVWRGGCWSEPQDGKVSKL